MARKRICEQAKRNGLKEASFLYLVVETRPQLAVHETGPAVLRNHPARAGWLLIALAGCRRGLIVVIQEGCRGRRRLDWHGVFIIALQQLLTSRKAFLEILVWPAPFARRRWRAGRAGHVCLWQINVSPGQKRKRHRPSLNGQSAFSAPASTTGAGNTHLDAAGTRRIAIAFGLSTLALHAGQHARVTVRPERRVWRHQGDYCEGFWFWSRCWSDEAYLR